MNFLTPLFRPLRATAGPNMKACSSRGFQVSAMQLKKAKGVAEHEEDDDFNFDNNAENAEDLFSVDTTSSSPLNSSSTTSPSEKSSIFQTSLSKIYTHYTLKRKLSSRTPQEKQSILRSGVSEEEIEPIRRSDVNNLVEMVQTKQELEEVRKALKIYRWVGGKLSVGTAVTLSNRCKKLDAPEILEEILADPITYGLHLPSKESQ